MKARELMIGSWVRGYYPEDGELKYRDFKVANIRGSLGEVESEEGEIFYIDECEGIPTTKEILEANGFKLYNLDSGACDYILQHNDVKIRAHIDSTRNISLIQVDINATAADYVHNIQTALIINGQPELAENFKIQSLGKGWKGKLENLDIKTYQRVAKMSKWNIQAVLQVWDRLRTQNTCWWEFDRIALSSSIKMIAKDIVKDNS